MNTGNIHSNHFLSRQLEKEEVAIDVLKHVIDATSYHVYFRTGQRMKAEMINAYIKDFKTSFKQNIHFGTIYGVRAIAYSKFLDRKNSIGFAKIAMKISPNCPIWHYVFGCELRGNRRDTTFSKPSKEEIAAFEKAYELSNIAQYGIKLATVYRESGQFNTAEEIYCLIYESNPADYVMQSRLALFFIRRGSDKDLLKAKACLECANKLARSEFKSVVNHYYGIYFEKLKDFEVGFI